MTHQTLTSPLLGAQRRQWPLWELLNPRDTWPLLLTTLLAGIASASLVMRWLSWPFWSAVVLVLGLMLVPGVVKWRDDYRRFGATAMGLSFLLAAQGFHTIEHIAQWVQYHILGWEARLSSGLISAANSEWVHFTWNWLVVALVLLLVWRGVRNPWAYALLIWAVAHSLEHTYMFVRFLQITAELNNMGLSDVTAQGLPGVVGEGGWLARNALICRPFLNTFPGLTTAVRIDVHFWWNIGEVSLLLLAAHTYLKNHLTRS